ncbi:hypothetical protein GALMADRAFT_1209326 [Galerina marginata CBS 339.88]|uniref:Uncharacterized protein n=1 Tax=Galerina marginata (strain CBS 339.88) TaxID=685588 RepID=A0A067S5P6_GALM3|nr:hypothetical protein GALMADRAFT_1209326 [Galerina marginata CBS 339.88]
MVVRASNSAYPPSLPSTFAFLGLFSPSTFLPRHAFQPSPQGSSTLLGPVRTAVLRSTSLVIACRRLPLVPSSLNVISSFVSLGLEVRSSEDHLAANLFWTSYTDQLVRTRTIPHAEAAVSIEMLTSFIPQSAPRTPTSDEARQRSSRSPSR